VWCLVVWAKLKLVACSWLSPFSANNKNTNKIGLHIFLKLYIPTHTERNKKHSCFVTQFSSGKICFFCLRFFCFQPCLRCCLPVPQKSKPKLWSRTRKSDVSVEPSPKWSPLDWLFFLGFMVDFGLTLDDFDTQNGRHNFERSFRRNYIIIWLSKFSREIAIQ